MKKFVLILLLSVLVFSFLLAGCGDSTTAPEGIGSPKDTESEVYHLTFTDWGPEQLTLAQQSVKAIKMVEERTNGRVKITPYFSESLVKYEDTFSGISTGVADIAWFVSTFSTGIHDLNLIWHRLFSEEFPDHRVMSKVYKDLLNNVPELQEEMEKTGVRWLSIFAMPGQDLHTTNKEVRVPEDVKGMKVQAYGDVSKMVNNMGGAAIEVPVNDWYMGFERGLFEGQFLQWLTLDAMNIIELVNCHTVFGDGGLTNSGVGYLVNLETWNSLPPDLQEVLVECFDEVSAESVELLQQETEVALQKLREKGNTFIEITPEEMALWGEYVNDINEEWIEETEAKGLPARDTFEEMMRLAKEYW